MTRFVAFFAALLAAVVAVVVTQMPRVVEACSSPAAAVLLQSGRTATDLQPRWTGCFDRHARVLGTALVTPLQVRGAVAAFELATEQATARTLQNLGAARALAGDLDGAEAALADSAATPDALANLAATHLLNWERQHDFHDLMLALDHASHAVALAPRHRVGLFNQALALSKSGLDADADRAWRHYLEVDPDSDWSRDIRRRLSRGTAGPGEQTVSRFDQSATLDSLGDACRAEPQQCRERLEDVELPAWVSAHLAGEAAPARTGRDRARVMATALAARGDALDADVVDDVERAIAQEPVRLGELARGLTAYQQARFAFERDDVSVVPLFVQAETLLTRAGSPLARWARLNRVYAEFNTYDARALDAVERQLDEWSSEAEVRGYRALAGRLRYLQSLTFANRARYAPAEPLFQASEEALTAVDEADHLAATKVVIADTHLRLGETNAGWNAFGDALALLPRITSARRHYVVLLNVGLWLQQNAMPYAALRILSSARDTALRTNQVVRVAESSVYLAKANARIGFLSAARADLDLARPDPERNGRWGRSERARREYLEAVAEVEREERPDVAIRAATDAIAFFDARQYAERVAPLHLLRGRAYVAAGDPERAERDFAAGIATYRGYRDGLASTQQRLLSQDVVWELYEERLQIAARRSPESALAVADEGRSSTLLESLSQAGQPTLDVGALQQGLGPDTRVLYYALLPRELLIWVIAPADITFRRLPVDRSSMERRVLTLVNTVQHDAPRREWLPVAEQLYDDLIAPVSETIAADARLVIIADGALHRLPFAMLRDRETGRHLVDTHDLSVAPSATVLSRLLHHPPAAGRPQRLFAVADPATGGLFAPLAGARQEVQSIARFYPASEVLLRDRATKAAFLSAAPLADVVHFAGHAMARPEFPLLASLEFAGEPAVGGSEALEAADIAAMHLQRTRLVVLAACTTGGGPVRRGEGVISIARPFLIAGAPAVVATLWDIDDTASAGFLSAFHDAYVSTGGAAAALRHAQRQVMATQPPSVWAAFVLIAGPDMPSESATAKDSRQ